jgi:hypothetical protein
LSQNSAVSPNRSASKIAFFSGYGTLAGDNPGDAVRGNTELAGQGAPR